MGRPREVKPITDDSTNIESVREVLPEDFEDLVTEFRDLQDLIAAYKDRCAEISPQIEAACVLAGKKNILMDKFKLTRIESKSADKILAERLVEKGVDWDIVEYATQPGKPYSYPLVTRL